MAATVYERDNCSGVDSKQRTRHLDRWLQLRLKSTFILIVSFVDTFLFHTTLACPIQLLYLWARLGGELASIFLPRFLVFVIAISGTFNSICVQRYLAYMQVHFRLEQTSAYYFVQNNLNFLLINGCTLCYFFNVDILQMYLILGGLQCLHCVLACAKSSSNCCFFF